MNLKSLLLKCRSSLFPSKFHFTYFCKFRKIHELETSLSQTRTMSKVSVDAVSSQLAEKTEELNCLRLENDSLRTLISSADTQQRNNNSSHLAKVSCIIMPWPSV